MICHRCEENTDDFYKGHKICKACIKRNKDRYRAIPAQYIYVITNPAWPDYVKIGRTTSIDNRLQAYQTGSPHRDYTVVYMKWAENVRAIERYLVDTYNPQHEWFKLSKEEAIKIIETLTNAK